MYSKFITSCYAFKGSILIHVEMEIGILIAINTIFVDDRASQSSSDLH